jgi:tetrapyrrole methylase family protein/MazG family protein
MDGLRAGLFLARCGLRRNTDERNEKREESSSATEKTPRAGNCLHGIDPSFSYPEHFMRMTDNPANHISSIADALSTLYGLVLYLRGEHGCPWDKAQDLQSMHAYLTEETVELGNEIEKNVSRGISEEWGDVLFILLMIAAIGEETGQFTVEKALRSVEAKMIRRHPHVFGSSDATAFGELLDQWENIKKEEKDPQAGSLMDNLPLFYSALKRAAHIQRKAAEVGFDWPDPEGVIEKIEEEARELREAFVAGDMPAVYEELGDLLFSCVNLARFEKKDAELLLNRTVDKFVTRFKHIEGELRRAGTSLEEATLEEMDTIWEQSKIENDTPDPSGT